MTEKSQILNNVISASAKKTLIGFSGHRNLVETDKPIVKKAIFSFLQQKNLQKIAVLVGDVGAQENGSTDDLVREVCKELNIIPLSLEGVEYPELAEWIAIYCQEIYVVWDGQFRGASGGTSDIVRMVKLGKTFDNNSVHKAVKQQKIHQLTVPRASLKEANKVIVPGNKFPFGRRMDAQNLTFPPGNPLQTITSEIDVTAHQKRKIFWISQKAFGSILLLVFNCYWINKVLWANNFLEPIGPSLALGGYALLIYLGYKKLYDARQIFVEFFIPIAMAFYTVVIGTVGFINSGFNKEIGDAIFAALNLLTLNTSIFIDTIGDIKLDPNIWLQNARVMGALFLIYAFFYALGKATGQENRNRIKFWFYRSTTNKPFYVVLGNGPLSINLAMNLHNEKKKVFFLSDHLQENQLRILQDHRIWYVQGNTTTKSDLKKTYFQEKAAAFIFIVKESDEENVRTLQEIFEDSQELQTATRIFISINKIENRNLVTSLVGHWPINIFNIRQQIARKTTFQHPVDRFSQTIKKAQIQLFGFNEAAQQLLHQLLHIGHFGKGKSLEINVHYSMKDQLNVDQFRNRFPELQKPVDHRTGIWKEAFNSLTALNFILFDAKVNTPHKIFGALTPNTCHTIYMCIEDGISGAAYIKSSIPILKHKYNVEQCDIKILLAYDYPDRDEEEYMEYHLNKQSYPLGIHTFGNLLTESDFHTVEFSSNLKLAKQINYMYHQLFIKGVDQETFFKSFNAILTNAESEKLWAALPEMHRLSNLMAADHAWIKQREWASFPAATTEEDRYHEISALEHHRWCAEKLFFGYHPDPSLAKADEARKLHPSLIPFAELTKAEVEKDRSQVRFLKELTKVIG